MNPLPNEMLFFVYKFTKVRSANSHVFVSRIGFCKVTIVPPRPFGISFTILTSVSLLIVVLYELD